ncbi:unnamed protein product [Triticum turgidum subsp. durum]|uniref:non-specific serine/threonine protein kinase n=1 Tax=Triticum turgidum subsp. durum TaxID=4567 RepID=A0A9R1PQ11_TRITD|nr:unnamed protein product [Triticum turgidum subsp. durum]
MALKAVSQEAARHKKSGGSGGGDGHWRIWFERDVLLALRHPLLPALRGVLAIDAVVGFAIDRCSGGDLNSLRRRQTEKMFSNSVIRYALNQLPYAMHCRRTNGKDLIRELIREHRLLIRGAGAAAVWSGAAQALHGRRGCCLRGQAHPEEDPSVDRHSEAPHWLH